MRRNESGEEIRKQCKAEEKKDRNKRRIRNREKLERRECRDIIKIVSND